MRPASFAAQLRADLPASAVRRVLDVFRAETVTLATALRAAADAHDFDAFRRVAHSMAGSAATVGAKELEARARLGIATAATQPARIAELAVEIAQLGVEACEHAAAVIGELT